MSDDVIGEVSVWFQERGFVLDVTQEGAVWWADLQRTDDPATVIARYGRGDTAETAAARARERYEQEQ